jgi:hypothetical protein
VIQVNEDDPGMMVGCVVVTIYPLLEQGLTSLAIDWTNLPTRFNNETLDHCFIN